MDVTLSKFIGGPWDGKVVRSDSRDLPDQIEINGRHDRYGNLERDVYTLHSLVYGGIPNRCGRVTVAWYLNTGTSTGCKDDEDETLEYSEDLLAGRSLSGELAALRREVCHA